MGPQPTRGRLDRRVVLERQRVVVGRRKTGRLITLEDRLVSGALGPAPSRALRVRLLGPSPITGLGSRGLELRPASASHRGRGVDRLVVGRGQRRGFKVRRRVETAVAQRGQRARRLGVGPLGWCKIRSRFAAKFSSQQRSSTEADSWLSPRDGRA